jgi:hypothetical protein
MIKAWIMVGEDCLPEQYMLPALPPAGTVLVIRDEEGQKRDLHVTSIEVLIPSEREWPPVKRLGGEFDVTVYCTS